MITCQFEDGGKTTNLRHVTVNAIVIKDNRILLGKRGTYNNGKPLSEAGKWGLLGGFFSRDETLEEAIKREVKEESGLEINSLQLFRINDNPNRPKEDRQNIDLIFLAYTDGEIGSHDEEVTNLEWFEIESLPSADTIAFDHAENLELYKKYLKENFKLPLF
jgi:8-oxo-dGTP diphosphatase